MVKETLDSGEGLRCLLLSALLNVFHSEFNYFKSISMEIHASSHTGGVLSF